MTIGLPISSDVNDLWPPALVGECRCEPVGESFAVVEQVFERDRLRNGTIVKEHCDMSPGRQSDLVRHRRVNLAATRILPRSGAHSAGTLCLVRRKDREAQPKAGQNV